MSQSQTVSRLFCSISLIKNEKLRKTCTLHRIFFVNEKGSAGYLKKNHSFNEDPFSGCFGSLSDTDATLLVNI